MTFQEPALYWPFNRQLLVRTSLFYKVICTPWCDVNMLQLLAAKTTCSCVESALQCGNKKKYYKW